MHSIHIEFYGLHSLVISLKRLRSDTVRFVQSVRIVVINGCLYIVYYVHSMLIYCLEEKNTFRLKHYYILILFMFSYYVDRY